MKVHVLRLKPGNDLKKSINDYVNQHHITAGWIATCVGSLNEYNIRFANQMEGFTSNGYYEIVSLSGTLSVNGSHLHISIADNAGKTIGGHLLNGSIVYTTAEIVIQETDTLQFMRKKDGTTSWEELQITEV